MFNNILLVSNPSESQKGDDSACVDRPMEGELESVTFRVKGKFLLLRRGRCANFKKNSQKENAAIEAVSSFEDANNS